MTEPSLYALRHRLFTVVAVAMLTGGPGVARAQAPVSDPVRGLYRPLDASGGYKLF